MRAVRHFETVRSGLTGEGKAFAGPTISPDRSQSVSIMELFHDQLPLAVPCYNLLPVTELTVGRDKRGRRALPAPLS